MTQRSITCPYCASQVTGESTVCPGCQEDLAALAHLEYADAIHYNLALALAKEGRPREAKAELAESLTANKAFAPSYALLAKICARELDWDNARINVKKALSLSPEDEAIVRLADEVINAAPVAALIPYTESVDIPANPTAIDRSKTIAEAITASTNPESEYVATNPSAGNLSDDHSAGLTPPVIPVYAPARPSSGVVDRRLNSVRKREPSGRTVNQSGQPTRPSSYLLPPQDLIPSIANTPKSAPIEPEAQPTASIESVEASRVPQVPPLAEPIATATEAAAPAEDSYGPLFRRSIWRTLGMGILITAGLAILIRAMGGDD